jgi:type I restriction enzyme S subunit
MEGRAPYLPADLWQLVPDRLDDEDKPEGWEFTTLGSLADLTKGCSYKSSELANSDTALVTLKSFLRGGGYRPDGLKPFIGHFKESQVVKPGEIVLACTDVTQAAEVIGRPVMVRRSSLFSRLVASLDTLIIRPKSERLTMTFLYFLCRSDTFTSHALAHTTGTTVLHLAKEAVPSFSFGLPPTQLMIAFDNVAAPMLAAIQENELENETLAQLRDTLLPKLISGELRIKDAATFIEAAQ